MGFGSSLPGRSRATLLAGPIAAGALALLLVAPGGALAAKKKLSVKVASSSQTQVQNQGALKVSYKAKGLDSLSATAKATPDGGSAVNFAAKASKQNPKSGTLSLPLTGAGQAALSDCVSLTVRAKAKGKPKKTAKAKAVLAEDDPECAKPVKEFDLESSAAYPTGIDVGPDGALWFAQMGAGENSLGRMTTDGDYEMIHIPPPEGAAPGDFGGHLINDVVAGPDGGIWATPDGLGNVNVIRRIDPAAPHDVTEFDPAINPGIGSKIAAGPDGNVWLSAGPAGQLVRMTPAGDITPFPLSDPDHPDIFPDPYGLAAGGDGAVWFTTPEVGGGGTAAVGRLDPGTGETDLFPLADATEELGFMTADAAGRLWFTTPVGNTIGRIDPSSGQVVEFKIPTPDSKPVGIAFADDGSLWFTEQNADNIGRYDPASGQFTEYPLDTLGSLPFDIVQGPDGKLYFTELGTGKIGQLDPNKAPAGEPNPSDAKSQPPFGVQGRCDLPGVFLCQQQVNLTGSTFKIGDFVQELPPETLKLTAGISFSDPNGLIPPASGPMLEAKPLDVVVGGTPATTRIGLAAPPVLHTILPTISVTVPIDLYVSQPGNPAGGCVIGPIVQNLAGVNDEDGDPGSPLAGDSTMRFTNEVGNVTLVGPGTLADDTFEVPAARGCGALTDIINNLLSLPSPSGENATRLPFAQLLIEGAP